MSGVSRCHCHSRLHARGAELGDTCDSSLGVSHAIIQWVGQFHTGGPSLYAALGCHPRMLKYISLVSTRDSILELEVFQNAREAS
jgi:hypothetical protein